MNSAWGSLCVCVYWTDDGIWYHFERDWYSGLTVKASSRCVLFVIGIQSTFLLPNYLSIFFVQLKLIAMLLVIKYNQ